MNESSLKIHAKTWNIKTWSFWLGLYSHVLKAEKRGYLQDATADEPSQPFDEAPPSKAQSPQESPDSASTTQLGFPLDR